jgi:D-alanyl-D-alanine carboxypeptidase
MTPRRIGRRWSWPNRRRSAQVAILLGLSALLGCGGGSATPTATTAPQRPTVERSVSASVVHGALQKALDRSRREAGVPGASAAVVLPDGTLWTGVGGRADIAAARSVTPATVFAAGSATKTFIAALVLRLVEQRKLSLDDRLARWVPSFPRSRKITVRQLLNHTAGTKDFIDSAALQRGADRFARDLRAGRRVAWTPEKTISFVHGTSGQPGDVWRYSNTNYILLGMIIKAVSKTSVDTALQTRLLRPRRLRELVLQPDAISVGPRARGYADTDGNGRPEPIRGSLSYVPSRVDATIAWTAGGLAATPRGLARGVDSLFRRHPLSTTSIDEMTNFVDASTPYGLGLANESVAGVELWGHYGEINGFQTEMWYLPEQKATLVTMINFIRGGRDTAVRDALLDTLVQELT